MKKEITFEEGMRRLDEIVDLLESGEAPLDESLKLFEEGVKLSDFCNNRLKKAEQKIIELTSLKEKTESAGGSNES